MGEPRWKTKTQTSGLPTFFFFFLLWRRVVSNTNKENQIAGDEAAYLKQLRKAVSPAPSSWFNVTNMRDWGHVTCTDSGFGLTVEEINLISMPLTGTLLPGLNNSLVNLKRLILTNNSLTGRRELFQWELEFVHKLHERLRPVKLSSASEDSVVWKFDNKGVQVLQSETRSDEITSYSFTSVIWRASYSQELSSLDGLY
ncbi:uncharacterized protein LOC110268658 [Arachis ipaensis]|uniref:uncharacterized protein LOC110268658 n=1 Tax=Arachis ipaensis TaxID=130454 RepID=UPI000A2B5A95|nr:uncharacterized protein LOC110268658 [Arachis ipaensis]